MPGIAIIDYNIVLWLMGSRDLTQSHVVGGDGPAIMQRQVY